MFVDAKNHCRSWQIAPYNQKTLIHENCMNLFCYQEVYDCHMGYLL